MLTNNLYSVGLLWVPAQTPHGTITITKETPWWKYTETQVKTGERVLGQ